MEHLLFSLNATIPIFLVMVMGYFLRRINMLDEPFIKTLNTFNFKVTLPFLVFKDISQSDFYAVWDTKYVCFCFFVTLFCILTVWLLAHLFFKDKTILGEFVQGSYRGSAAVMGLAFIQNIYGNSGMAPLMIIGTVPLYNVAAVFILSLTGPDAKGLAKGSLKKTFFDALKNPIVVGIFLGMAASLLRISFPAMITKTIGNIGQLASPLALIALGAGFEGKKAIKQIRPTLIGSCIKLVIPAAVFLPLAIRMGFRNEMLVALLVMLGAPTTPSCYVMAKNMGHEGILTSSLVVTTTFLSSLTLTAFLFIFKTLGYI